LRSSRISVKVLLKAAQGPMALVERLEKRWHIRLLQE
jgi:hypothetical protein